MLHPAGKGAPTCQPTGLDSGPATARGEGAAGLVVVAEALPPGWAS